MRAAVEEERGGACVSMPAASTNCTVGPAMNLCPRNFPSTPRNVWLTSEQHLDLNFNPASLLSIGDARAFIETVQSALVCLVMAGRDCAGSH